MYYYYNLVKIRSLMIVTEGLYEGKTGVELEVDSEKLFKLIQLATKTKTTN